MLLWAASLQGADTPAFCRVVNYDLATTQRLWPLVMEAAQPLSSYYQDVACKGVQNVELTSPAIIQLKSNPSCYWPSPVLYHCLRRPQRPTAT